MTVKDLRQIGWITLIFELVVISIAYFVKMNSGNVTDFNFGVSIMTLSFAPFFTVFIPVFLSDLIKKMTYEHRKEFIQGYLVISVLMTIFSILIFSWI